MRKLVLRLVHALQRNERLRRIDGLASLFSFAPFRRPRVNGSERLSVAQADSVWPELAAVAGFLALLWTGITVALSHERNAAEVAAVQATGNLARALEESARRTIGQIDYVLLSARASRLARAERFDFQEWVRTQTFADRMTAQIAMADETGLVTSSTIPLSGAVNVSDRNHFRSQIDPAHDDLFISKPVIGRVSRVETIQFSRKLLGPHGEFAGITVVSLACEELSRFYEALELGAGSASILSADGTIMARGPRLSGTIGSTIQGDPFFDPVLRQASGSIKLPRAARQGEQITSFRRLKDYPIIVMVGLGSGSVFRPYLALRQNALVSGFAVTLVVGLLGVLWVRLKQGSLASRRALSITLDTISQGILMVDGQGGVSVMNARALDLLTLPGESPRNARESAATRAMALVASQASTEAESAVPRGVPGSGRVTKFETPLENGAIIEVNAHSLADGGFVHTYTDVTEQRLAHARVRYLAHHDTLTGLANRVELRQRLSDIVDRRPIRNQVTALMMIDLDGFKGVNDTLGHDAGDELLVEVGRRLRSLVRDTDVVARLGGDEFVILGCGLRQPADVIPLVQRVLRQIAEPQQMHGQQVRVGASLGIAFHPQDGGDVDTLFKHADMALYSAKTGGRGTYRCFDEQLTHAVTEQRLLESDLRKAIENEALEVHFQPKFGCGSLEIVGFEALARWWHPTRGYISPASFIHIAEESGMIDRLGRYILEQACRCVAAWEPRYPVAVNVSVMQLRDGELTSIIAAALEQTGLESRYLEIEVTESVMADGDEIVLRNLQAVKAMGVRVALDDFGTGYSSLSYLRRFPFDKIKIDRSFVQGQADDPGVRVILEAILGMCHNLGLATVGEGVETQEQLDLLRDRGCTEVQGYLLGRPMPQAQVQSFIIGDRDARLTELEPALPAI